MSSKIAISQFKAHCLKIIDNLQVNGESIIITKRDKPIAKLQVIDEKFPFLFGMLKDKAEIKGELLTPIDDVWGVDNE